MSQQGMVNQLKQLCSMDLNVMSPPEEDGSTFKSAFESVYKCADCGKGYRTIRDLISHQGVHSGEYPYVCEYCHKGYKNKMNLTNHINLHTGEGYECDVCKKMYSSAFLLKQHKRWHVQEKRFVCKLCGKAFKIVEMLRNHTKHAHSDNLYSCPWCKRKLCSEKALQMHIKHHGLQSVACPYCSRSYKSRKSLRRHLVLHEARTKKLLTCPECAANFVSADRLKRHIGRFHPQKVKCIYCGKCLESEKALSDHIAQHKKKQPVSCQYCGGPLLRRHRHKDWATQFKPLHCPRCTAQFHYPAELLEHASVHGDDPAKLKWECSICGRIFLCHSQYEKHLTKPHPPTPGAISTGFSCSCCCKLFKNGPDLKEHVKSHFNDPQKDIELWCQDCGKVCTTLTSLNRHRLRHFNTNLFSCLYCSDVFKALTPMRLHMKLHLQRTGAYHCHLCDMQFMRRTSHILHLECHSQDGDSVCMKCLVAFPSKELYAAHKRVHSLPCKCSKCGEQYRSMALFKQHVENGHCCTKLFLCGRCNLGLLSAEDLAQHKDNHVEEDATNAKSFKASKVHKSSELSQDLVKGDVVKLKTYCSCVICNPPQSQIVQAADAASAMVTESTLRMDSLQAVANAVSNADDATLPPLNSQKGMALTQTEMNNNMNAAILSLNSSAMPSLPGANDSLSSLNRQKTASSKTRELQTLLQNATVKKVVLALPANKTSDSPIRRTTSEDNVSSLPMNHLTSKLPPNHGGGSLVPTQVPHYQAAGVLPEDNSEQMLDLNAAVLTYPLTDSSTIVPNITNSTNMPLPQSPPPSALPLLTLFTKLLVQILGQEPKESLSYAIITNIGTFLVSFLQSIGVHATEITTDDTIWLCIQNMVRLFDEENDELVVDYALNNLDSKTLVEEMLICMDAECDSKEVKVGINNSI